MACNNELELWVLLTVETPPVQSWALREHITQLEREPLGFLTLLLRVVIGHCSHLFHDEGSYHIFEYSFFLLKSWWHSWIKLVFFPICWFKVLSTFISTLRESYRIHLSYEMTNDTKGHSSWKLHADLENFTTQATLIAVSEILYMLPRSLSTTSPIISLYRQKLILYDSHYNGSREGFESIHKELCVIYRIFSRKHEYHEPVVG